MPLLIALVVIAIVFISIGAMSVKVTMLSLALKIFTMLLSGIGLLYVFQRYILPILNRRNS